ncbi:MAG: 50S ribosome-binding GTPase [Deltaproteobacteria bacterium]|jgi:small GTP-binding protein|nr:50S ribosome-binding GTPase [Deltaproteobacteria bacterium]
MTNKAQYMTPEVKVRERLKLVFTGHVDHGKSTVIGRLLYDTNSLNRGIIDKVKKISAETGQPFEFAFLLDAFEEEQKQGITIDTTQLQFKTEKRDYVIIDAPGHKEFLKNMISGAADAEAAFLVIDAARGLEEQSRRHAHMLALLGLNQIGVIVNKMDLVQYDRMTYEKIVAEISQFLANLGLETSVCLPLSALSGQNIVEPSPELAWSNGPTLIEALDSLAKGTEDDLSFRLPLQDVYKFDDRRILVGRIEAGSIKIGDRVALSPGRKVTTVTKLAAWLARDEKTRAHAGESVGLMVSDEFFNRRGEVVSSAEKPPLVSQRFKASIFWMGRSPLIPGHHYKLKLATSETEAWVSEIIHLIDSATLDALPPTNNRVGFNEVALVEMNLSKPIALDLFSSHKATGRFVLISSFDVVGGGIITWAEDTGDVKYGFIHGQLKARCEVFEEYYYNADEMAVNKIAQEKPLYTIGDLVPLTGQSYVYPEFFDIVIFRDLVAVKIRAGQVADILPLSDYAFQGWPLVNGRGFGVMVRSQDDWLRAKADLATLTSENQTARVQRWLDFNTYRHIPIGVHDYSI